MQHSGIDYKLIDFDNSLKCYQLRHGIDLQSSLTSSEGTRS